MILAVLHYYGAALPTVRLGWQPIRCPFHDDEHQSASVNVAANVFRCHGCNAQGGAIKLIMEQEGIEFREAQQRAKDIALDFGGEVPQEPVQSGGLPGKPRSFIRSRGW